MLNVVHSESLADRCYQVLRQGILTNDLPPESLWSDRELCERFSLSRTPVREAILRLQTEQLVQIVPRKGTRILPLLISDVRDIHQVTKALELEAALLIAKAEDNERDLEPLRLAVKEMEAEIERENRDAWAEADRKFHHLVVDMAGNARLAKMYHAQRGLTDRARYFALHLRPLPVQSTNEHRGMYEALVARDLHRLEQLYRLHWDRTTEEILTLIERHAKRSPIPLVTLVQ